MDSITEQLVCDCNGRMYPSRAALNSHRKTKIHQKWENELEMRDLRCRCKRLENENEALKYDLKHYRELVKYYEDESN